MPLIWRLFLLDYLKVISLSTIVFVMLLLTMRLEELAQFATLGGGHHYLLAFAGYQLAFIVPIALPLSALISALLLMRRFSESGELMALRALGFSILDMAAPLLWAASLLALVNFYILSEVATQADRMKHSLKKELQTLNPLTILHNEKLTQLKGIYAKAFGQMEGSGGAEDLLLCVHHKSRHCLMLLMAKQLTMSESNSMLIGRDVTLFSPIGKDNSRLVVENSSTLKLPRPNIGELFHSDTKLEHEHAPFIQLARAAFQLAFHPEGDTEQHRRSLARLISELTRRIALGFSILSFTFLGLVYGISFQRSSSIKPLLTVLILATLYICSVLFAKKITHLWLPAMLSYTIPQLLMLLCASRRLYLIEKGI